MDGPELFPMADVGEGRGLLSGGYHIEEFEEKFCTCTVKCALHNSKGLFFFNLYFLINSNVAQIKIYNRLSSTYSDPLLTCKRTE